jgi:hypothetical protein
MMRGRILLTMTMLAFFVCVDSVSNTEGDMRGIVGLSRVLIGKGFHVTLQTNITLQGRTGSAGSAGLDGAFSGRGERGERGGCEVRIVQELPAGVFVDVDQVTSMQREGRIAYEIDVRTTHMGDNGLMVVDVEAAEFMEAARPLHASIAVPLSAAQCETAGAALIQVDLPLHVRYHASQECGAAAGEREGVVAALPSSYASESGDNECSTALIRIQKPTSIEWVSTTGQVLAHAHPNTQPDAVKFLGEHQEEEPIGGLMLHVPIGNTAHLDAITYITCAAALAAALRLISA